ncbi:MAG: hypothetical protein V3U32_04030, partial [Anaerolineales bacterium]
WSRGATVVLQEVSDVRRSVDEVPRGWELEGESSGCSQAVRASAVGPRTRMPKAKLTRFKRFLQAP